MPKELTHAEFQALLDELEALFSACKYEEAIKKAFSENISFYSASGHGQGHDDLLKLYEEYGPKPHHKVQLEFEIIDFRPYAGGSGVTVATSVVGWSTTRNGLADARGRTFLVLILSDDRERILIDQDIGIRPTQ